LKKLNRGEYHYLQEDEISYIFQPISPYSNDKWKEHLKEKIHFRHPSIQKSKKSELKFICPQPNADLLEEK
jgi:hypothetical protein